MHLHRPLSSNLPLPCPLRRRALDCGYRHLDCASLYQNQALVGKDLAEWVAAAPGNRREDVFITTKVRAQPDGGARCAPAWI